MWTNITHCTLHQKVSMLTPYHHGRGGRTGPADLAAARLMLEGLPARNKLKGCKLSRVVRVKLVSRRMIVLFDRY